MVGMIFNSGFGVGCVKWNGKGLWGFEGIF